MENQTNQDTKVTINGVEFSVKKLTDTFPDSYFTLLFNGNFVESRQTDIQIKFPLEIYHFATDGSRYIKQIAYRLRTGCYQYPGIRRDTALFIIPEPDGNRFISLWEMEQVIQFLQLDRSELDLVEAPDEISYPDNGPDEVEYEPDDYAEDEFLDEDVLCNYELDKAKAKNEYDDGDY